MTPVKDFFRPRYLLEAAILFFLRFVLLFLPVRTISQLGGLCGRKLGPRLRAHDLARANLAHAMPQTTPAERETILRAMWDNLGRTGFEYAALPRMTRNPKKHLSFDIHPDAETLMQMHPCRCVFFSAHIANWELMPMTLRLHNITSAEIYRPPNNPYANWWVGRIRRNHIAPDQLLKRRHAARTLIAHIKQGHAFGLLMDQFAYRGLPASFFGKQALTNDVLAVLHLRYHYHLVPVSMRRVDDRPHFVVRVHKPLSHVPCGDYKQDALALTQQANDVIEAMVRDNPGQWLWPHRRWGKL